MCFLPLLQWVGEAGVLLTPYSAWDHVGCGTVSGAGRGTEQNQSQTQPELCLWEYPWCWHGPCCWSRHGRGSEPPIIHMLLMGWGHFQGGLVKDRYSLTVKGYVGF